MLVERRAVIDIGTNSVKLLVGDVSGRVVEPVLETSHQTRLGHGFYESHLLQREAIEHTQAAVADFAEKAKQLQAAAIRIIATSAVRDATNRADLVEAVREVSGIPPRIITGNQEADYAYKGVLTDPKFASQDLLLLDMGGGSTEFVLGCGGKKMFSHSFALGTLRLMDALEIGDPPAEGQRQACLDVIDRFLRAEVRPLIEPMLGKAGPGVQLVGTGGTAGILARIDLGLEAYDREAMESVAITRKRMHGHIEHLWSLPLLDRQKVPGLPPRRADVILTGVAAYVQIMEEFGFEHLRCSTRGLRFALLLEGDWKPVGS